MKENNTPQTVDLEGLLVNVTLEAGTILREHALDSQDISWKGEDDPVTAMDKRVERLYRERITEHMPANFLGEEYGFEDNGARYTFIIDPIDGTKAYMRQDFLCAISVGIEEEGDLVGGIVYDFMKDIMYVGFKGVLYRRHNGKNYPFSTDYVAKKTRIIMEKNEMDHGHPFAGTDASVSRRLGSIALAMTQLASGAYDCMIMPAKNRSNTWDIAAGTYLLQETGHTMTDREGLPFDHRDPRKGMLFARPEIYDCIQEVLGKE